MKNIKSFSEFGGDSVSEGALGTAAASLGMRSRGSTTPRNTGKGGGDKNEWKKYVNPKRWFSSDKEEEKEEEYCDSCDRVKSKCVCDKDKVNELFGMKRDMKTRRNLANIKEISDKQKENEPEAKLDKYKKMRDDLIKDLEDSLEEDEVSEGRRGSMNPAKRIINSVFRKYGLKQLTYHASGQVRGWGNYVGKGYRYEYPGLITLKGIDPETTDNMVKEINELGVKAHRSGSNGIEYRDIVED